MTEERQRELSALMDGELDPYRGVSLFDRVAHDPELRGAWERWHLIGLALRGERIDPHVRRTADSVRERLAAEPLPLAPPRRPPRPGASLAPFAGAALAAGLAFVGVLAVPALFQGPAGGDFGPATAGSGGLAAGTGTVPAADARLYAEAAGAADSVRRWRIDRPELATKLDLFLVNHQEVAPASGVKGLLPYATLVGYDLR